MNAEMMRWDGRSSFANVLRAERRQARRLPVLLIGAVVVVGPTVQGIAAATNASFRTVFDLFTGMLISPVSFTVPVLAVALGCLGLTEEVAHRFISSTRTRIDARATSVRSSSP